MNNDVSAEPGPMTWDDLCRFAEETAQHAELRERFNTAWIALADRGQCDELGGMEYERVFREWVQEGSDRLIGWFIYNCANKAL